MKLRCAILDDYQGVALRFGDWAAISDRVEPVVFQDHFDSEEQLAAAIGDCEIAVLMRERTPFAESLFLRLPRLKLLVTTGLRNASIDLSAAKTAGVTVCGTASFSEPPAELTWALILALARQLPRETQSFRTSGPWQSTVGTGLRGKTLGLIGLGKIGEKVARVGNAFGMELLAWSQNLTTDRAAAANARLATSKEQLLQQSDFVTIHLVLGERSLGLIGAAELRLMKPEAYLINTSRAQIVDRTALINALGAHVIAGAAVDVFEIEPLPLDDELRRLPNFLGTPHLGYVSDENYRTYYREIVENIEAFLKGAPVRLL